MSGGAQGTHRPEGHSHRPETQASAVVHACPHVPQFAGSDCTETHVPLQSVPGAGQAHVDPTHTCPPVHGAAHVQLDGPKNQLGPPQVESFDPSPEPKRQVPVAPHQPHRVCDVQA